jgi:hypothetical protein
LGDAGGAACAIADEGAKAKKKQSHNPNDRRLRLRIHSPSLSDLAAWTTSFISWVVVRIG